jgi:hypothetical protein|tara:strand:+ start:50 stop:211 length:162 start_codon:yes stop_codon:yes gene_type:complete
MKKLISKIKKWWRRHIAAPVSPEQEDILDKDEIKMSVPEGKEFNKSYPIPKQR